jgi:hypothetical protein
MSSSERNLSFDAWERNLSTRSGCGTLWSGQKAMSGPVYFSRQHATAGLEVRISSIRVNEASCWMTCETGVSALSDLRGYVS